MGKLRLKLPSEQTTKSMKSHVVCALLLFNVILVVNGDSSAKEAACYNLDAPQATMACLVEVGLSTDSNHLSAFTEDRAPCLGLCLLKAVTKKTLKTLLKPICLKFPPFTG